MATTYTVNAHVSCVKQHVCLGCDAQFRYQMERDVSGTGNTEEAAGTNAEKAAVKSLENDVDQHACPHCGMMQPDMIAEVRSGRFSVGMWLGPLIVLVGFFLALPHVITISTSATIAMCGVAVSVLLFVNGIRHRPNADMESARIESTDKVDDGVLALDREGSTSSSIDDFSGLTAGHITALVMAVAAFVGVVLPDMLVMINGWTANEGAYPAVVGPGDTTCVYFDGKIRSLKGMWRGSARATLINADDFDQPITLRAKTKSSSWGNTISGKNVHNEKNTMWTEVTVLGSPKLAGKTADMELSVNATFPLEQGGGFVDSSGEFQHRTSLAFSAPRSGRLYWQSWLIGQLGAAVLVVVAGMVLRGSARSLCAKANAPTVFVRDVTGEDVSADDEEESTDEDIDADDYDDVEEV